MATFLVISRDGTDADAPSRRAAARAAHLDGVASHVAEGSLVFGGRLLDDANNTVGSFFIADCPDRAAVEALIANDPYVKGKVWQSVDIKPVQIVVRDGKIVA